MRLCFFAVRETQFLWGRALSSTRFLRHASGGPISFSSKRNGGKNAAKNPWFFDFLLPLISAFQSVRNVESTYFSERCRFCSEMRRCVRLHFTSSTAAGISAEPFRILDGFGATAMRNVQGAKCSGRKSCSTRRKATTKRIIRQKDHPAYLVRGVICCFWTNYFLISPLAAAVR